MSCIYIIIIVLVIARPTDEEFLFYDEEFLFDPYSAIIVSICDDHTCTTNAVSCQDVCAKIIPFIYGFTFTVGGTT